MAQDLRRWETVSGGVMLGIGLLKTGQSIAVDAIVRTFGLTGGRCGIELINGSTLEIDVPFEVVERELGRVTNPT